MELKDKFIDKLKSGKRYKVHNCSMCEYPCSFFIEQDKLFYDSGCDCVRYTNIQERSFDDLDFYFDASNGHIPYIEKFLNE